MVWFNILTSSYKFSAVADAGTLKGSVFLLQRLLAEICSGAS